MKFTLEIDCDNAAFEGNAAHEVGRILMAVRQQIRLHTLTGPDSAHIRDENGNTVGHWTYSGHLLRGRLAAAANLHDATTLV